MIKVAVIGASGYTGAELLRLLTHHPEVEIQSAYSRTNSGKKITAVHTDLLGHTDLAFSNTLPSDADLWFLCLPHGESADFLTANKAKIKNTRIIDLSNSFRHMNSASHEGRNFVFGLPELNAAAIQKAENIANPGCFATAITLALAPLYHQGVITAENEVHVNATTGSTGAGTSLSPTSHFSYRSNNLSWYKPFVHQHLAEIAEQLTKTPAATPEIHFLAQRGAFTRGIFATAYTKTHLSLEEAKSLYNAFYKDAAFTHVSDQEIHLKSVVGTNNCQLHLHKHNDLLLVTSIIDNLLKGASGQAVENMNLMYDFKQTTALGLKATYY